MEGYDVEVVGEVPIDLYCTICLKLMRDAIQMKCGHGMCQPCFQKLADSCKERKIEVTCPSCRQVVKEDHIICNMMLDRVIAATKIKCSNHKLGCEWIGLLQSSNNHLLTDCNYHMVKCSFESCNKEMLKNILSEHEATCEFRVVQCDFCTDVFLPNQLVNHAEVCEYYPMKCRNKMCSELIPRCKIEEHLQLDCLYEKVECSFHSIGCCAKFLRKDFNAHLHEFNQKHMLLLLKNTFEKDKHIEALQEESRVVTQNAVENEKRLLIKIDELEKKICVVKKNSVMTSGRLDQYEAQNENVLGKLINIEQKFQDLTCLTPQELTGSRDDQKSVIAAERNESLMVTKCSHVNLSDGICDVQQLESLVKETFEKDSRAPIDVLLETFESESKKHHEQWLSNDINSLRGVSEINKAGLPSSESYLRIIINAVKQNSKISNFQQVSRMEKYCHLLSSKKMFENGGNTVQFENHSFVRHQYSLLRQGNYQKVDVSNHTVKLCKHTSGTIYFQCGKAKEVYIINKHLQKAKLTLRSTDTDHYYTAAYDDLITTEYVKNDWILLEIVWKM